MGFGDVGAMHDGAGSRGNRAGDDDDSRETCGNRVSRVLHRHGYAEHNSGSERGGVWVDIGDGVRVGAWADSAYGDGTAGVDGMRGDRVGVGDIFALPGAPHDRSYATGVRDSRRTYGDGKRGRVCRLGEHIDVMETESRGDRIDIGNSVWVRAWDYGAYCDGAGRADGM